MKPHQTQLSTLAALFLIAARIASADVTLNALFADNFVLQRDVSVRSLHHAFQNFCPLTISTDEGLPVAPWNLEIEK